MENKINTSIIKKFIEEQNFTNQDFCEFCIISEKELNLIFAGSFDFELRTLFKISKKIGVEIHKMFI